MSVDSDKLARTSCVRPIKIEDGRVLLLDQRKIPERVEYFDATALSDMFNAIKDMIVRGAPVIGVAAALGLASEGRRLAHAGLAQREFIEKLDLARKKLQSSRPTAVNLRWATDLIFEKACKGNSANLSLLADELFAAAISMVEDDIRANMMIGRHGASVIPDEGGVLTHCNAGALATCGWGTALGVIRSAWDHGKRFNVYVDETRPRQQGARLTTWELLQDNITPTLITDSMAGYLMAQRRIDVVIVGADRIATNGDAANKIGTYTVAVLAHAHNIPFYIAAPLSTIDPHIENGDQIPIEEREASEVTVIGDQKICPPEVHVWNPAFDVTPARLVSGIICQTGILRPPYTESIQAALAQAPD